MFFTVGELQLVVVKYCKLAAGCELRAIKVISIFGGGFRSKGTPALDQFLR